MANGTDTPYKLSPQGKQDLIRVQQRLPHLLSEIERGESAGLDMSENRAKYNDQKTKVDGMLRVFG